MPVGCSTGLVDDYGVSVHTFYIRITDVFHIVAVQATVANQSTALVSLVKALA